MEEGLHLIGFEGRIVAKRNPWLALGYYSIISRDLFSGDYLKISNGISGDTEHYIVLKAMLN